MKKAGGNAIMVAKFTLRRAQVEDAELLAEMRIEMRRERESSATSVDADEFFRLSRDFFRTRIAAGDFISYIAWAGDQAAACSGLSIQRHPPTYANPGGRYGYITNMYTRPAWRRMGAASLLVEKLAEEARRAGCARLGLNASPMGRSVYLKCGFRPVDGEMSLDLTRD